MASLSSVDLPCEEIQRTFRTLVKKTANTQFSEEIHQYNENNMGRFAKKGAEIAFQQELRVKTKKVAAKDSKSNKKG